MNPIAAALLGVLAGGLLAAIIIVAVLRRPAPRVEARRELVSPQLAALVSHLRSAVLVVGPHDEVLATSAFARSSGLVRGPRIASFPVLELVREVRRQRDLSTINIELPKGPAVPPLQLAVRVFPLDDQIIVVLADDRSAALRIDETRRDFVANVSHELKTPIGAMALLVETVEEAADDPEAVRRFMAKLGKETTRLSELVSQIIALSRLQSTDPMLAADEVPVARVVANAAERCRLLAAGRDVTINTAAHCDCTVLGDETQLSVAVTNLVENAIAYSDPGARVAVAVTSTTIDDEDYVEIRVSDNGIGISEEDQARVFERFYRVDYGRSREHGGTGLGLSIVQHVVQAHGGSVSLWSKVGRGSTFTLTIPAHSTDARSDQPMEVKET